MTYRAPVFFLLFLMSLIVIIRLAQEKLNFIPISIISAAYFLFYPLFAYLVIYLGVVFAFGIAFSIIAFLIFNYSRILYRLSAGLHTGSRGSAPGLWSRHSSRDRARRRS